MVGQTTNKKITTKHRVLRLVLRRKPCLYISICELSLLIILISCIVGLVIGFKTVKTKRLTLDQEDELLNQHNHQITFAHCRYENGNEHFNTDYCSLKARQYAFAYRHYHLASEENDPTCIDRHQQVQCHEYLTKSSADNLYFKQKISWNDAAKIEACSGLFKAHIVDKPKGRTKYAPIYKNNVILNLMENNITLVHTSELFIRCPICTFKSKKFEYGSDEKKCYRNIGTVEKGWPAIAYNCNDFAEVQC